LIFFMILFCLVRVVWGSGCPGRRLPDPAVSEEKDV
jgi:hypothetical protein